MDSEPALRYLTALLHVDYLKPTSIGSVLEIRGRIKGEVVAVQVPESLVQELLTKDA